MFLLPLLKFDDFFLRFMRLVVPVVTFKNLCGTKASLFLKRKLGFAIFIAVSFFLELIKSLFKVGSAWHTLLYASTFLY